MVCGPSLLGRSDHNVHSALAVWSTPSTILSVIRMCSMYHRPAFHVMFTFSRLPGNTPRLMPSSAHNTHRQYACRLISILVRVPGLPCFFAVVVMSMLDTGSPMRHLKDNQTGIGRMSLHVQFCHKKCRFPSDTGSVDQRCGP